MQDPFATLPPADTCNSSELVELPFLQHFVHTAAAPAGLAEAFGSYVNGTDGGGPLAEVSHV